MSDGVADGETGQTCTFIERLVVDRDNRIGDVHTRQPTAALEGIIADIGNSAGNIRFN